MCLSKVPSLLFRASQNLFARLFIVWARGAVAVLVGDMLFYKPELDRGADKAVASKASTQAALWVAFGSSSAGGRCGRQTP